MAPQTLLDWLMGRSQRRLDRRTVGTASRREDGVEIILVRGGRTKAVVGGIVLGVALVGLGAAIWWATKRRRDWQHARFRARQAARAQLQEAVEQGMEGAMKTTNITSPRPASPPLEGLLEGSGCGDSSSGSSSPVLDPPADDDAMSSSNATPFDFRKKDKPPASEVLTSFVVVFFNPAAGAQTARRLQDTGVMEITFSNPQPCTACFFPLEQQGLKAGIRRLKDAVEIGATNVSTRVLVCGGDGSVAWVLDRLVATGLTQVPVAIMPLGTGNDMARVLGWGATPRGDLLDEGMRGIRETLMHVCASAVVPSDLWTVDMEVADGGKITAIKRKKEFTLPGTRLSVTMMNYASWGLDAQVVFETERHRRSSPLANQAVYALQGALVSLAHQHPVSNLMASLLIDGQICDFSSLGTLGLWMILNIPSYGGGSELWRHADSLPPEHPLSRQHFAPHSDQDQGDKTLELLATRSLVHLGAQISSNTRALGGALRVAQGRKYQVRFLDDISPLHPVYLQVDGEAFRLERPTTVTVRYLSTVRLLALTTSSILDTTPLLS